MTDQSTIPTETGMLGACTIGILAGVTAAVVFVTAYMMGADTQLWLVFPIYIGVGVIATFATAFGAVIVRRNRCWDRRCLALQDLGTGSRRSTHISHLRMRPGVVERPRQAGGHHEYSLHDFSDAQSAVENARVGPRATKVSARTVVGTWAGPRLTVIDGGLEERGAAGLGAEGQQARLGSLSATVVDRLFARVGWTPPEPSPRSGGVIGYLGDPEAHHLAEITEWAGSGRVAAVAASADTANWSEITSLLRRAEVIFVDADFMGDVGETIDLCLQMRNYSSNSILILISSEVRGHDLTAERSAICDATLKTPLTERAIQAGVSAAYFNSGKRSSSFLNLSREAPSSAPNRTTTPPPRRGRGGHLRQPEASDFSTEGGGGGR